MSSSSLTANIYSSLPLPLPLPLSLSLSLSVSAYVHKKIAGQTHTHAATTTMTIPDRSVHQLSQALVGIPIPRDRDPTTNTHVRCSSVLVEVDMSNKGAVHYESIRAHIEDQLDEQTDKRE